MPCLCTMDWLCLTQSVYYAIVVAHFQLTMQWFALMYIGFPIICHNEVFGITVTLLFEVCYDINIAIY